MSRSALSDTPVVDEVTSNPVSLLINRDFALLWSGQAISILGDLVFTTTITIWVGLVLARGQNWGALAVSGTLIAAALPPLLVAPLAGVLVDRWDKRQLMIAMDAVRAVAVLGLVAPPLLGSRHWSPFSQWLVVCSVVLLVSCCEQFFRPSMTALINDLVPQPLQPRAIGLGQVSFSLAAIAGPPLATLVLFGAGLQWALLLNGFSFLISCLSILAIRPVSYPQEKGDHTPQHRFIREFGAGVRFFVGNRKLRTLTVALVIALFGAGAFQALDLFFITRNLHAPPSNYGLLEAAQGLGMLLGAVLASIFSARTGLTRVIWSSLVTTGVLALIYARLTSFLPAAMLLFVIGIPLAFIAVAVQPLVLSLTPRDLIGRVLAVIAPITTLAGMLGVALAGYLDSVVLRSFHLEVLGQHFGPIDSIFSGAGLLAVLGGFFALAGLRGRSSPPAESAPSHGDERHQYYERVVVTNAL
jgi:MFS family permease